MSDDVRLLVIAHSVLAPSEEAHLRSVARGFTVITRDDPGEDLIPIAEIFAGHMSPKLIPSASKLRWNHLWSAGADADLSPEMRSASHVHITTSAGNGAIPLAEHALMLMLMLDRNAPRWMAAQYTRTWDRFQHGELAGKTVGIVGMGAVGRDLARKCAAFDMHVIGVRGRPSLQVDHVAEMFGPNEIVRFAGRCDYLVVVAPLTSTTRGMIDSAVLSAMKSSAAIVNVSRGEIIDDEALRAAFSSGHLSRAGLDAHATEPLPADSSWWAEPGVIITPHNGATTAETTARAVSIFLDNVERYIAGRALRNLVDKTAGYSL